MKPVNVWLGDKQRIYLKKLIGERYEISTTIRDAIDRMLMERFPEYVPEKPVKRGRKPRSAKIGV